MSIKTVLFDLDGTLLPMDQDVFVKAYFGGLSKRLAPLGYDPQGLVSAIWQGTAAMVKNNGEKNNEAVFWDSFASIFGEKVYGDLPYFDAYYAEDFDSVKDVCGFDPMAKIAVDKIKTAGLRVALATNPIFPSVATEKRMAWAGFEPKDFELFTTYENSKFCKPNLDYYRDILNALGEKAENCLMVGNDVREDMIAEKLGMKVFLITKCLINKDGEDISKYPSGDFSDLIKFIGI